MRSYDPRILPPLHCLKAMERGSGGEVCILNKNAN